MAEMACFNASEGMQSKLDNHEEVGPQYVQVMLGPTRQKPKPAVSRTDTGQP